VASVGRPQGIHSFGFFENPEALEKLAEKCGHRSFQVTNSLRDVKEDADKQRV